MGLLRKYNNRIIEIGHILIVTIIYDDPNDINHIDDNCHDRCNNHE
jgi:hypothetical protein